MIDSAQDELWNDLQQLAEGDSAPLGAEAHRSLVDDGWEAAAQTTGGLYKWNVDNFLLSAVGSRKLLAAICQGNEKDDGCAIASALVVLELRQVARDAQDWNNVAPAIVAAIRRANRRIARLDSLILDDRWALSTCLGPRSHLRGIGTSVTALAVDGANIVVAHIGECAAYLLRRREIRRLTRDHRLPGHNDVVTRFVGLAPGEVEVDVTTAGLVSGDSVIVCSSPFVRWFGVQQEIMPGLADGPPEATCESLMALRPGPRGPATASVVKLG
jgi:serine/threonine protein phosphatase PrpC